MQLAWQDKAITKLKSKINKRIPLDLVIILSSLLELCVLHDTRIA